MLFTAAFGALALFLFTSGQLTSASSSQKQDSEVSLARDSLSQVKDKFQDGADEARVDEKKSVNMKVSQRDWYGGGLWLRARSPLRKDQGADVHGFEPTTSQKYNQENEKQHVISIHESSEEKLTDIKNERDLRNGGLWRKDELPQLLNAVLEMEEGKYYKYNVPYDALKGKKEGLVATHALQQGDSPRFSESGGKNEKKVVRGPRVGKEISNSLSRKDKAMQDSLPFSFNANVHKDQWHIAPRAGKDFLEPANTKHNFGKTGHIGGSIWAKKDGGLWAKKDGGLWAKKDGGLWAKKDGGLWAKRNADLWSKKDGGLWAKREGGLWAKKEGGLWAKKDGGLWAKKDGGLWAKKDGGLWAKKDEDLGARKDGLLAEKKDAGLWLWRKKGRSLSGIHTSQENEVGSWRKERRLQIVNRRLDTNLDGYRTKANDQN